MDVVVLVTLWTFLMREGLSLFTNLVISPGKLNWKAAKEYCNDRNGRLLVLNSQEKWDYFTAHDQYQEHHLNEGLYWIGMRFNDTFGCEGGSSRSWVYSGWGRWSARYPEPDGCPEQSCVLLWDNEMFTTWCYRLHKALCETIFSGTTKTSIHATTSRLEAADNAFTHSSTYFNRAELAVSTESFTASSPKSDGESSTVFSTTPRTEGESKTIFEPTTFDPTTSDMTTSDLKTSDMTTSDLKTSDLTTFDPTTSDPTTSDLKTSDPTTSDTTTSGPTTSDLTTFDPTTSGPTTSDLTTSDQTTSDLTTFDPTTSDPTTSDPTTSDLTTFDPTTYDPTTSNTMTSNPTTSNPTTYDTTRYDTTTSKTTTSKTTTSDLTTSDMTTSDMTTSDMTTSDLTTSDMTTFAPTTSDMTAYDLTTFDPTTYVLTTSDSTTFEPTTSDTTTSDPTTSVSTSTTSLVSSDVENDTCIKCCLLKKQTKLARYKLEGIMRVLRIQLAVNKTMLSSQRRKLVSVYDSRPSCVAMGGVACIILAAVVGVIVVPDGVSLGRLVYRQFKQQHDTSVI
ncbi:cell wall protein DAN4-like [Pecten maximus]|uniref:cell wall protein DAN4-like n=1 Tax=Pecten maximus TaxID=6579 RepID=UPI001458D059|nr:cell wall protein DAN4-like [Pecten maximus]